MVGRANLPNDGMSCSRPSLYHPLTVSSRWLYTLYLMVDANFKLRLKDRGAEDVYLGPGWAYVVEEAKYKEHINMFANTKEVRIHPIASKQLTNITSEKLLLVGAQGDSSCEQAS